MARPLGQANKRKNIEKSFVAAMNIKNLDDAIYRHRMEQYLEFYDRKTYANERIKRIETNDKPDDNAWVKVSGEVRQLDRQMMEIEKFFGFKPSEENDVECTPL